MGDRGLVLDQLAIRYADGTPLLSISAEIAPGHVLSLMGPSGIGKSTVLAAITGTLPSAFRCDGTIALNGRMLNGLPPQKRRVGILFQDHLLFPHLSVGQNIGFGLPKGTPNRSDQVHGALTEIGLAGFADRDPATLSGGQRARVALMRMLLSKPEALLLDEPFSRLDIGLRAQVRSLVFERARSARLPVLMVTHDAADAEAANGQIISLPMQNGQSLPL
ncbi:ATP-binding cassette domain-containing protein [Tateyamaria omphalii]|uniref:ATP-binding cassette domain-containing protein n=1 Tax=Tateyamaria omphalii TaxID=299262 RepID=UPI001C99A374|nr:ATP-binding cassette domain-containing protein [Tateyamaria omphalii]MBY5932737.1 ATP-binding cassette domain-containing protein [Tateyamaria omphalii]